MFGKTGLEARTTEAARPVFAIILSLAISCLLPSLALKLASADSNPKSDGISYEHGDGRRTRSSSSRPMGMGVSDEPSVTIRLDLDLDESWNIFILNVKDYNK